MGGLFLVFVAWDVGSLVWKICHPDPDLLSQVSGFKDGSDSCFEDDGIGFNPKRWLLYSACTSAFLGAGALASAWLVFRGKRWGRVLWLTLCILSTLYFFLFWGNMWAGWFYAGIYALAFVLSLFVVPKPGHAHAAP